MPRSAAALLCLIGAVAGAALVLVVAKAGGWLGGTTKTVVVQNDLAGTGTPVVVAKPVEGNGFSPAQVYRARSAGVVTIYSYFDSQSSPAASAGQGSGFVVAADGTI